MAEFLDHVVGGLTVSPDLERMMRSISPDLPDDPRPEQLDAWIELADLLADPDYRDTLRRMDEEHATTPSLVRGRRDTRSSRKPAGEVATRVGAALAEGIDAAGPDAEPVLDAVVGALAAYDGEPDTPGYLARMLANIGGSGDERVDRYWRLLATINSWPPMPAAMPAWRWVQRAFGGPESGHLTCRRLSRTPSAIVRAAGRGGGRPCGPEVRSGGGQGTRRRRPALASTQAATPPRYASTTAQRRDRVLTPVSRRRSRHRRVRGSTEDITSLRPVRPGSLRRYV